MQASAQETDGPPVREMTLRQYLRTDPAYREETREPRRLYVHRRTDDGTTELQPVRIVQDIRATLETQTDEGYLVVQAQTSSHGLQAPYFSLTATLYRSESGARRQSDSSFLAGGCLHEEVLAAFPELAPIEALHLSDVVTGEPMHAAANGWYHYRLGDPETAARTLRVHPDELPVADEGEGPVDEATFYAFVETLRERWAREAHEGRELLVRLAGAPTGKPSPNGTLIDLDERG